MNTEMHRGLSGRRPTSLRRSVAKLPWMLAWVAAAVSAQPSSNDPAHTLDSVSGELEYVSELGKYQPYADPPLRSWREANDEVGRIGGWRSYAKEAAANRSTEEPTPTHSRTNSSEMERP